jgi:hypothetical protein
MGQINGPGSLLDQITALYRELNTVRRGSGAGGGASSDGSLVIQRGGSLRMLAPDGTRPRSRNALCRFGRFRCRMWAQY